MLHHYLTFSYTMSSVLMRMKINIFLLLDGNGGVSIFSETVESLDSPESDGRWTLWGIGIFAMFDLSRKSNFGIRQDLFVALSFIIQLKNLIQKNHLYDGIIRLPLQETNSSSLMVFQDILLDILLYTSLACFLAP